MSRIDYTQNLGNRIYMVYLMRKVLCARGLGISWLVLSAALLLSFVSIISVIRNFWIASRDLESAYGYVAHSFANTDMVVQAISVSIIAVLTFFAFDFYRSTTYNR